MHRSLKFDLKTVLQIADQIIVRVTALHEKSLIHRDIKPQNICVGLDKSTLFLIDFGLAKVRIQCALSCKYVTLICTLSNLHVTPGSSRTPCV